MNSSLRFLYSHAFHKSLFTEGNLLMTLVTDIILHLKENVNSVLVTSWKNSELGLERS